MSLSKTVAFLVFLACTGHATLGLISGEITLRGGSEIALKSDPVSFIIIIIIAIEIVASLYIFWAFFIDKEKDNDAEDNNYPSE